MFEDDHLLLYSGDAVRDKALDTIAALGADTVHALVRWDRLEPAPGSYGDWSPWDGLVAAAQARGLKVLLSPTRAPAWASECRGPVPYRQRCSPRVAAYGDFVRAVAARYPSVDEWSFWNEPNHARWLIPQSGKVGGVRVDLAAMRYRALVLAGVDALRATGHGGDLILMGETAPIGSSRSIAPVTFYRDLFCLDSRGRRLSGRVAKAEGCTGALRFNVSGIAHHPYTYGGLAKPSVMGRPGDAPIGALGRVIRVMDQAARYGIVGRRLPLYLTEFGYQTRPPDPFGMSLSDQARYLNESDYIAYLNPRVASVAQYTLQDDKAAAGFNTGLSFATGRVKPALVAYELPIWVFGTRGGRGTVFGQVRPARTPVVATILHRASRTQHFAVVASVRTNARGFFVRRFANVSGQWRLHWQSHYSRIATAG